MLNYLKLLGALVLSLAVSTANAAITRVAGQHVSNVVNTGTSLTLTLPNNPTTGNLVVMGFTIVAASLTTAVSDSASNAYTATTHTPSSSPFVTFGIYYLTNAPGTATKTVTLTWGGTAQFAYAWMQEYAGEVTTSTLEQEQVDTSASMNQTAVDTPTFTPTNANDLIFAVGSLQDLYVSPGTGYAIVDGTQNNNASVDEIQTTATATGTYINQSAAGNWVGMVAAFKAAGGGGGGSKPSFLPLLGVGN